MSVSQGDSRGIASNPAHHLFYTLPHSVFAQQSNAKAQSKPALDI